MNREVWVLKLGGGAITHKQANKREARIDVIRGAARQIARARGEHPSRSFVVVHGAGPFGHTLVADYGIADGVSDSRQVEGFVRTHNSMVELNRVVVQAFADEELLAFPLPPSACVVQRDGQIESFFTEPLQHMLELSADIIPILYGDMVVDSVSGATVVSGDTLVACLGRQLNARKVLLGTNVSGVFSADPGIDPTSRRIERIDDGNLDQVLAQVGESVAVDVTHGMRGKVEQLVSNLGGVPALIFDLTEPDNLYRALTGRPVQGTEVVVAKVAVNP